MIISRYEMQTLFAWLSFVSNFKTKIKLANSSVKFKQNLSSSIENIVIKTKYFMDFS